MCDYLFFFSASREELAILNNEHISVSPLVIRVRVRIITLIWRVGVAKVNQSYLIFLRKGVTICVGALEKKNSHFLIMSRIHSCQALLRLLEEQGRVVSALEAWTDDLIPVINILGNDGLDDEVFSTTMHCRGVDTLVDTPHAF